MKSIIKSQPTIFVIFGGTGDLSQRKIGPALYNLFLDGWMPEQFTIIGTGRTQLSDEDFSARVLEGVNQFSRSGKAKKDKWDEFSKHLAYQVSDINDFETYKEFGTKINGYKTEWRYRLISSRS